MARISTKTGRKEWTCDACLKPIEIGDEHRTFTLYKQKPRRYHIGCNIPYAHTTSSEYKLAINNIIEQLEQVQLDTIEQVEEALSSVENDICEACSEAQNALYSLPEQFQEGSTSEERMEALEDISINTTWQGEELVDALEYVETLSSELLEIRDI